jgi:hypothetical protein
MWVLVENSRRSLVVVGGCRAEEHILTSFLYDPGDEILFSDSRGTEAFNSALIHQVRDVRSPMLHDHLPQNLERWLDVTIDLSMVAIRNGSMKTALTGLT